MNNKKVVIRKIAIGLIGIVTVFGILVYKNSCTQGISVSDDIEEREQRIIDSESRDNKTEASTDLGNSKEVENSVEQEHSVEQDKIAVHVCGQVKKPGVYELKAGTRVSDAIEAAGGLTGKAAGDFINQAQKLVDEEQLYVPSKDEVKDSPKQLQHVTGYEDSDLKNSLININQASREELMTLPGIGEAKADMIITYRDEHGRFATIEEIKNISGIKDGVYNKICDLITTD